MLFLHCARCDATVRAGLVEWGCASSAPDDEGECFRAAHAGCGVRIYRPTSRAMASGPWHEPMVTRWLEVRDGERRAVAIGGRASIDEPLAWRLEHVRYREERTIALDRAAFCDGVARALVRQQVPWPQVAAWLGVLVERVAALDPDDVRELHDDPSRPECSAACLTEAARASLQAALSACVREPTTRTRLGRLFDDAAFPPLRVSRRLSLESAAAAPAAAGLARPRCDARAPDRPPSGEPRGAGRQARDVARP